MKQKMQHHRLQESLRKNSEDQKRVTEQLSEISDKYTQLQKANERDQLRKSLENLNDSLALQTAHHRKMTLERNSIKSQCHVLQQEEAELEKELQGLSGKNARPTEDSLRATVAGYREKYCAAKSKGTQNSTERLTEAN